MVYCRMCVLCVTVDTVVQLVCALRILSRRLYKEVFNGIVFIRLSLTHTLLSTLPECARHVVL